MKVTVIGGGLAGCEAAWQVAKKGVRVKLYEMKPGKYSPAHHSPNMAELVCSNSLRSAQLENAAGLLKEEMRTVGSLIMQCADECAVPAGGALAVDREIFSKMITEKIEENELIDVVREEVTHIPDISEGECLIVASGPLTSESLAESIKEITGDEYLYFYDAAAPIVTHESIDMGRAFKAARYGRGEADYINCPMTKDEYDRFWSELVNAETAELKHFEKQVVFEGCMPVETMAKRGEKTLLFGPLKPVGLVNPYTQEESYAVVQMRQDNKEGTLYNLVGFQTHLKWSEQKRIFRMIPGLENAEFVRYGVMHRNTYINSPKLLTPAFAMRSRSNIFFAGQITGVEGYIESTASGLIAGINAANKVLGEELLYFPRETAHGALSHYIAECVGDFQPMNINFGLIPPLNERVRDKRLKNKKISERALITVETIV